MTIGDSRMTNTTKDNATKLAALCEQAGADYEKYEAATKQLAGNSMLSDSGRQATQAKLDASWKEQRAKLIADASALVEEIYSDERNAEVGFLINPNVVEAIAIVDKLGDTLDVRAIRELGVRFLGGQAPLRTLAAYMKKKGIPSERVDAGLGSMVYGDGVLLEMRDALDAAKTRNVGGEVGCMAAGGAVSMGAAEILASYEKPEPVAAVASRTVRTVF